MIAVGSEMLGTRRLDTNSLAITKVFDRYGVRLVRKSVVGDDRAMISRELLDALEFADVVVITGGLGPTEDDLTRESVAQALGLELIRDQSILDSIRNLFSSRGMTMPSVNEKQASVFAGQRVLTNRRGTAPGHCISVERGGSIKHLWLFPGVPWELDGMIEHDLLPWLAENRRLEGFRRVIRLTGITESGAEAKLKPFYERFEGPLTILASKGEIQLHLHASGPEPEARGRVEEMEQVVRSIFETRIFGVDDEDLEAVVGRLLMSRSETVSTAESCTGGLLGSRITDVSGSSAYFMGGVVAYTGEAKMSFLGVDPKAIDEHGQVSELVAKLMAQGVRRKFSTTWGVGITGIAGPGGGTTEKPVGTVHAAVANQNEVTHRHFVFRGSREIVKFYASQMALDLLRLAMTPKQ